MHFIRVSSSIRVYRCDSKTFDSFYVNSTLSNISILKNLPNFPNIWIYYPPWRKPRLLVQLGSVLYHTFYASPNISADISYDFPNTLLLFIRNPVASMDFIIFLAGKYLRNSSYGEYHLSLFLEWQNLTRHITNLMLRKNVPKGRAGPRKYNPAVSILTRSWNNAI